MHVGEWPGSEQLSSQKCIMHLHQREKNRPQVWSISKAHIKPTGQSFVNAGTEIKPIFITCVFCSITAQMSNEGSWAFAIFTLCTSNNCEFLSIPSSLKVICDKNERDTHRTPGEWKLSQPLLQGRSSVIITNIYYLGYGSKTRNWGMRILFHVECLGTRSMSSAKTPER